MIYGKIRAARVRKSTRESLELWKWGGVPGCIPIKPPQQKSPERIRGFLEIFPTQSNHIAVSPAIVFPGIATGATGIGPISSFSGIRLQFAFIISSHFTSLPV